MKVEAALARSQAEVEQIPDDAAEEITETSSIEYIDLEEVEQKIEKIDLFTVVIIQMWTVVILDRTFAAPYAYSSCLR